MVAEKIGFREAMAMAVGGMVGGGIFAVLGVVVTAAGTATWLAFVVSGVVAMAAGYSFVRVNDQGTSGENPITYIERFTGSTTLAGMMGWTFVIGYVGTMALYSYAFGGYVVALFGIERVGGLPARQLATVLVVVAFVGLNALGSHASGRTEDLLVGLKVLILLGFSLAGIYFQSTHGGLDFGMSRLGVNAAVAGAIAFVAFEGWELLLFDQGSIEHPLTTVPRAVYLSIASVTGLYVLVALATTNLVPVPVIARNVDSALALAAQPIFGRVGFALVSVAALFSTGSALNATLFSSARLTKMLVDDQLFPSQFRTDGEPLRALVGLGVATALLGVFGSLDAISSFASLAFVVIFGSISLLAFRLRGGRLRTAVVPAIGVVGAVSTVVALGYHLAVVDVRSLVVVLTLAVAVIVVELFYFERDPIERLL